MRVGFSRQITFVALVVIYHLNDVVFLLSPLKSLNLIEEVIFRVELLILRGVRGSRAFHSFLLQPFRVVKEAFNLIDSALSAGRLWLRARSLSASHLKDNKSNKQGAGLSVHSKNKCSHARWCVQIK